MMKIDKDCYDFLLRECFSDYSNHYEAAARQGYLDMCRTLRPNGKNTMDSRIKVSKLFENEIKELLSISEKYTQTQYDEWHKKVCEKAIDIFDDEIVLTIGQAQKWLNMTMKYLYVLNEIGFEKIFEFLHVPIDSFIIDAAYDMGVKLKTPWSKINDYKTYSNFQKELREKIKTEYVICPMKWEFRIWNYKKNH